MNLDIKRAFQITFRGDRWFEKILIGVILMVIATAVAQVQHVGGLLNLLLASLTLGYSVRVMRQETKAASGALPTALPDWSDWTGLLKDGVLLTIANCIYALGLGLLFVLSTATLGGSTALSHAMAGQAVQIPGALVAVWLLFALAALVLFALYMPMMAAHYANEQRFTACFEVPTVLGKVFANFGNVVLAVVSLIGLMVLVVLLSVTVILLPVAVFLSQVIAANIWAQVYRNAGA